MTFDLKKAATKTKKENSVEKPVCRYARSQSLWHAKVTFPGHRGAADRIFLGKRHGKMVFFFVEFKRPSGGKATTLQKRFAVLMRSFGINVYFVNDVQQGKDIIDAEIQC